jgi:hypothetical protein
VVSRAARLGQRAFRCGAASLLLQPVAVAIAMHGDPSDATAAGIVITLIAASLFALIALVFALQSLAHSGRSAEKGSLQALFGLALAALSVPSVVAVGVASMMIASKGGWLYMV